MRKVLLSAVSVASLGFALSVAQAADIVPEAEPVCVWCGFHIGVGGGAGYNFYDADSAAGLFLSEDGDGGSDLFVLGNAISGDDLGAWYGFGTVEIGFDFQFDDSPFVIGVLANYDFNGDSSADAESATFTPLGGGFALANKIEAELDDSWFVGGRLGFAFNQNTLIYALGGYTWIDGQVKAEHALITPGDDFVFDIDEDDNVDGWTLGGGIEHLLTENLSLKVEYRHDFLDEIDFDEATNIGDLDDDGDDDFVLQEGSVDFSRDTIRAVLSWRFNPWGL